MANASIIEHLKKLVELQKFDETYFQLKEELNEKPGQIEALQAVFEKKKTNYKALNDKLKNTQLARKQKELDLKSMEDAIARANTALSMLKTNKEYTAKIGEIEGLKADKSLMEEKILMAMDETDAIAKELEKEKILLAEEEKKFFEQKAVMEGDFAEMKDRLAVIESQRKQLMPGIDQNLLRRYERILEHKGGIAIVPIAGSVCGGCYMNITQQQINQLKMHDKVIECEMCSRILYLEGDV